MREIKIPKGGGRYRTVVVPSRRRKRACREWLPRLAAAALVLDVHGVAHGCVPGRSPVSNAAAHVGYGYTLSLDLADCFDHVTEATLEAVGFKAPAAALVDGVARQGLPTSPACCNIALAPLDAAIVARLAGRGAYTRYVDDLTISSDERAVIDELRAWLPDVVRAHGHEIAAHKTRLQSTPQRVITGVSVGATPNLRAPRSMRRRLRAARHQLGLFIVAAWRLPAAHPWHALLTAAALHQAGIVRGLGQWCELRPPDPLAAAMRTANPLLATLLAARAARSS